MEMWHQNWQDVYDRETRAGTIENIGQIYEGGPQFWMVPVDFAREFEIKFVDDMKRPEVVSALAEASGTDRPLFPSCIDTWSCAAVNKAKFAAYGLQNVTT